MSVYRYESERLISFIDWPYPCLWIEPTDFAAAGFYYTGTSDVVRCFECHIEVSQWNAAGGSPKNVHQRCAKTCRFVQNIQCGNVPIDTNPKAITIFVPEATLEIRLNNEDQAIIPLPIYPEYKSYVARLKSFANWPLTNIHNNIEKMAVAGLFYTGTYDVVMCYQCGGGLLAWEPNYDPLIEHIKFYRYCPYVCLIHKSIPPPIKLFEEFQKLCEDVAKSFLNLTDLKVSVDNKSSYKNIVKRFLNLTKLKGSVDDKSFCKICFEKDLEVLFLPCRHLMACEKCAQNVTECSICQMVVKLALRVYIIW
ncbi:PREDICTED: baculoviral IAP repeat-containing protein 7-B-like [Cyphomyrmex costatus]|uniref:baculoviral IAP repeat-containing protein 7-B-like n=1 Tax=Cyphomyrmex costatus TaxID=456900 RepID=UPI0008523E02|nr:PREDICTED: baculoviral IAP repeat-containing protein 7-B-like [Cyphomyrmex costatus]